MIKFQIDNDVIPDVVQATVLGVSPHDGFGNPGRGRTTHLLVTVVRSTDRSLVPQPVGKTVNGDGSAVDVKAKLEFLDPRGLVQHTLDIRRAILSAWQLEMREGGAAYETARLTVTECSYHAGGSNAAFTPD